METVLDVQLIMSCLANLHCVLLLMYSFCAVFVSLYCVLLSMCLLLPLCVFACLDSCVITLGQHKHAFRVLLRKWPTKHFL